MTAAALAAAWLMLAQTGEPVGPVGTASATAPATPTDAPVATDARAQPSADPTDITVTGRKHVPGDPLLQVNVKAFAAAQALDHKLIGPVASAYEHAIPAPVRDGLRNVRYNLHDPIVALNFLLQLKPGKAAETLGRFAINSTIGIVGLVDFARRRPFGLPRRMNGFADTFGHYHIGPGPFLFLPLIGATTVRDFIGNTLDGFVIPHFVGGPLARPSYTIPASALRTMDHRRDVDADLRRLRADGSDPYSTRRDLYLRSRQEEIAGLR